MPLHDFSAGSQPIYANTLTSDTASIDTGANGVSQSYTHLIVQALIRTDEAIGRSTVLRIRFNNDSGGTQYFTQRFYGNGGGGAGSEDQASGILIPVAGASDTSGWFGQIVMDISFYRGSQRKTATATFGHMRAAAFSAGSFDTGVTTGFWNDTSAITRIAFVAASGNLVTGSSVYIYGY